MTAIGDCPVTEQAYRAGEPAPDGLEAVEYTVVRAESEEADGWMRRKIVLWVGLHPDMGCVNIDAGRERLEEEGFEVLDWGAA
jgi:hypothetical protein